ncbi:MAG TPA: hypothetical protein VGL41_06580, partial [Roseiarcus sp.]
MSIFVERFRCERREHVERRQKRPLQLDDAMDGDVAKAQEIVHRRFLSPPTAANAAGPSHISKNTIRRQRLPPVSQNFSLPEFRTPSNRLPREFRPGGQRRKLGVG